MGTTMLADRCGRLLRALPKLGLIALAYFVIARVGLAFFVFQPENVACVWPVSGFALAVLLLNPRREWPGIISAFFLGNTLANLAEGSSIEVSLGFAVANSAESLLGAWIVTRYAPEPITLESIREYLLLVLGAAVLGNALTALLGAAVSHLGLHESFWDTWKLWWIADGVGILIVTPLVVLWVAHWRDALSSIAWLRVIEFLFVFGTLGVTARYLFESTSFSDAPSNIYLLYPLLIWIALRFRPVGAATASLILAVFFVLHTAKGHGPFMESAALTGGRVLAAQVFLSVMTFSTFVLAVVVAERKRVETALQQSEAKFSKSFYSSPDAITVTRIADGRIVDVNQGFEKVFGISHDEAVGQTTLELGLWFDPDERVDMVRRLQSGRGVRNIEWQCRKISGETFIGLLSAELIEFDGEPCILGLTRDITPRKQAEKEREELIAKLEVQNEELERFTYTVSHDLKSPLITIGGYAGMLREDLANGYAESVENDLAHICTATAHMEQLLTDLLELSRIGRQTNPSEDVSMVELAEEARRSIVRHAKEKDIQLDVSPDLPKVSADRTRLGEVLQNLIDNAAKNMGEQPHPRIEIKSRRDGDETVFYVRDNGIGIDPRYQERVFDLFEQLDRTVEGSGVGLAIVKRIIEIHRGRIWIESEGLGHGSTFCFTIGETAAVPDS